jgi:hypothetical protein
MESVDAGIFFDQMMSDLSDGNLSRKEDMVQFLKDMTLIQIKKKPRLCKLG